MNTRMLLLPALVWQAIVALFITGWLGMANAGPLETANVMAPLRVNDWSRFEKQLKTVKDYGVDAVSVDVWWGEVEATADNQFKWDYYDTIFAKIKAQGLKIVPILSFHQCGGNVGDDCNIPLPSWLWSKYVGRTFGGLQINDTDLKYKSEQGHFSQETIQLWADPLAANEYTDFVNAFKAHFAAYAGDVIEINVSAGPSGELRYPSYNAHDSGTGYPSRGGLQSYSRLAVQDFRQKMLDKYGTLAGVNQAWGINLADLSQIQPPDDAGSFFRRGDYKNIQYGKDFIDWYNQALVDHGKTLLANVINTLGNDFPMAKIGYKIPGVHWAMVNPDYPRAAEVAAGLIQTSVDFNSDASGHGYTKVVGLAKTLSSLGRGIVLHFTCLEMNDQNGSPRYSEAKKLVFWVAQEAQRQGVTIKGENALADGVTDPHGWDNIVNAFEFAAYSGLTTLRIGEVASGLGQSRYAALIQKYRGTNSGFRSLYLRGTQNNWGATPMVKIGSVWSLSNVSFGNSEHERFKFDVLGDWSQNYGGSGLQGSAVKNGMDIAVAANTTYNISFDEAQKNYAVKPMSGPKAGLGVSYSRQASTFALWSPDSSDVKLWLDGKLYPMQKLPDGNGLSDVYEVTVNGDHHLKRYHFQINGHEARDPYGVMVEPASNKNIVVDLALTEPDGGWVPRPPLKEREDSVIYEVHVRDFTIDQTSGVDPEKRGKFLGMVQSGSRYKGQPTGIDHLKELGVTHVQILPFYDYRACAKNQPSSCYSWGYDPLNFNVPEENYSISQDPIARIRELKTMINEFHKAGIRVVMDVVYNHTADQAPAESTFSPITSQYFTGTDLSGTGNAVDARKPMVGRFIRDSLAFWAREYHVDGFRFDLIGIFDYETVGNWGRYLNQQFPDANLLIYGEPWNGYASDPDESKRVRLGTVGRIADAHVGVFNPKYREALKGDNDTGKGGGYIFNQQADLFPIRVGSRGAIRFSYSRSQVLPNLWDQMFANDPEQTINYVSAHDNLILRDKILKWTDPGNDKCPTTTDGYPKRIQEFANGIILTSQGIPFLHAGDEMLRTKKCDKNSFESPDSVNAINWQWKIDNADVVDYYKQAISLRKSHPGFRMTTWEQINGNVKTDDALRAGVVVTRINGQANGDDWKDIIVIYNSAGDFEYSLPSGSWKVAMEKSDPKAGQDRSVSGKVIAEGTAVTILHQ